LEPDLGNSSEGTAEPIRITSSIKPLPAGSGFFCYRQDFKSGSLIYELGEINYE